MREILFRGKTYEGEWVYGDLLHEGYDYDTAIWERKTKLVTEVIPETIGEFTSLTDKNGKKIFECDILEFNYTGNNKGVEGKAVVVFENGKFGVKWGWHKEFVALDGFANTTLTVIGNLHDNPELLKEVG